MMSSTVIIIAIAFILKYQRMYTRNAVTYGLHINNLFLEITSDGSDRT